MCAVCVGGREGAGCGGGGEVRGGGETGAASKSLKHYLPPLNTKYRIKSCLTVLL